MASRWVEPLIPPAAFNLRRNFEGFVFISDIDKTYLSTQIDSITGLLSAAFETAERKVVVPGFSFVLRAIRRGSGDQPQANPLFFLSASPPQIEGKIRAKMEIDKVEHDGIIFKDQMAHVRRANFHKLREQLGYKIFSLLRLWQALPKQAKLIFFGDDSESDPLVFSLFSEILAKNVEGRVLSDLLESLGVSRDDALVIGWVSRRLKEPAFPVHAAFVNLESGSRVSYYERFGNFLIPTENSIQTALVLFEMGLIRIQAIRSILKELVIDFDFQPKILEKTILRAIERKIVSIETINNVSVVFNEYGMLDPDRLLEFNTQFPPGNFTGSLFVNSFKPAKCDPGVLKFRYSEEGRY